MWKLPKSIAIGELRALFGHQHGGYYDTSEKSATTPDNPAAFPPLTRVLLRTQ